MSGTDTLQADVAIVGSGVAGAMLAWDLARHGLDVLVLEAGPRVERGTIVDALTATHKLDLSAAYPDTRLAPRPDLGERDDPYLVNVGEDALECEYLRLVGGTTWHWAAVTVRPLPHEFAMKTTYSVGEDWPIDYATLEPWYTMAEYEMGVSGRDDLGSPRSKPYPLPPIPPTYLDRVLMRRLEPHGFRFQPRPSARNSAPHDGRPECQGFGSCSPICPTGAQYAAIVHVRKAEAAGARVLAETLVTRVDVAPDGRVEALRVRRADGSGARVLARTFVLAANGLETPRLMLMSRSDAMPEGLANRSGQVGRNLMDHPGVSFRLLMPEPVYPGRGPDATINYYGERDGAFRRNRSGFSLSAYNRLHLHDIVNDLLLEGHRPPELDRLIREHATREIEFDTHLEVLPDPRNRMLLDDRRVDSAGLPRIRIHYRLGDYTLRGIERCRSVLHRMAQLLGADRVRDRGVFSHHHLMGTARMGDDPKASVVDRDCRAHDHPNLFLAGSAVFPAGGTANPTLTIAALSLRLAATIRAGRG